MCNEANSGVPCDPSLRDRNLGPLAGESNVERAMRDAYAKCASPVAPNITLGELRRARARLEEQQREVENKLYTVRQLISLFE